MRAPELQLIDRLEEIKCSFAKKVSPANQISLSPAEYKKNLLSNLLSRIASKRLNSGDESAQQDITLAQLAQLALETTDRLVDLLIEKSEQAQSVTPEKLEAIVTSLCDGQPKKSGLANLVMMTFVDLLKDYRESIAQMCGQYNLTLPQDGTDTVVDFSDPHYDVDGKVTVFRLQEMKYILDLMLNQSVEALSQLHPVKDLPYVRHITMTNEIAERIISSQHQLTDSFVSHIENTQQKLRELMVAHRYCDTVTDIKAIIETEAELLADLEEKIAALALIRAELKVAGSTLREQLQTEGLNALVLYDFVHATQLVQEQFAIYQKMEESRMRAAIEMKGGDVSLLSSVASSGMPSDFGVRSRDASRFCAIEQIVCQLTDQLHCTQLSAGKSKSDFDLRDFVRELKERSNSFDSTMASFENIAKMKRCLDQFKAQIEAFTLAQQQASRSQTAASLSSLFGSQQRSTDDTTRRGASHNFDKEETQAAGQSSIDARQNLAP
ncbi:MAG: hypothetical protein A3F13_09955 [Gammaproteobacteria bacterium RIFCSPHIGHO2_12_FULL_40_19]|nr:MAG: hypothetical protein A3F13_09955 [Gammaproteobacteria bacterium RIFCSPHIGHO2_12_FULL_40_19]